MTLQTWSLRRPRYVETVVLKYRSFRFIVGRACEGQGRAARENPTFNLDRPQLRDAPYSAQHLPINPNGRPKKNGRPLTNKRAPIPETRGPGNGDNQLKTTPVTAVGVPYGSV